MRGMGVFFCVDDHWLRTLAGACRRSVCGLPALRLRLAVTLPVASGKKFGTEGRFQEILVHGRDVEHYLLIDLLARCQRIRYRSPI